MLMKVRCNKCKGTGTIDMGDKTIEEFREIMKSRDFGQCICSNHVELGKMSDYYEMLEDTLIDGSAPTDEEWLEEFKQQKGEVWDSDELTQKFTGIGFTYGMCFAKNKETGEDVILNFTASPCGKRYYYIGGR
jgi:hypothetical protein